MKKKIMLLTFTTIISINLFSCGNKNQEISSSEKIYATPASSQLIQESEKKEAPTEMLSNIDTKESYVKSPLEIGQTGIITEYSYHDNKAYNAYISLINIMRGDEVNKLVNEYTSKNTKENKVPQLMSNQLEYAIAEYTLTLSNDFPDEKYDASEDTHPKICNLEGKSSIIYDFISYDLSTTEFYTGGLSIKKGESKKYFFLFAIPKGCNDYLISFKGYRGSYTPDSDKPETYFKGK